jgi:hypothetical protein
MICVLYRYRVALNTKQRSDFRAIKIRCKVPVRVLSSEILSECWLLTHSRTKTSRRLPLSLHVQYVISAHGQLALSKRPIAEHAREWPGAQWSSVDFHHSRHDSQSRVAHCEQLP